MEMSSVSTASPERAVSDFCSNRSMDSICRQRCVKILAFVAGTDDFTGQAQVVNGASQVFIDAFGEEGRHARSAIGTNSLPLGLTVEVESIFEINED